MRSHRWIVIAATAGFLFATGQARAGKMTCEGRKSIVTTGYIDCRLAVTEQAILQMVPPDFSACEAQFATEWQKVESGRGCDRTQSGPTAKDIADRAARDLATVIMNAKLAACGNGVLEADEQCDSADLGGATCSTLGFDSGTLSCTTQCVLNAAACAKYTPTPRPTATPTPSYKRAFVTSLGYSGDLGGIAGADAECNSLAASAGMAGLWAAWLSTPAVNAWERISDAEYRRVDGALIAVSLDDLVDGTIANPINLTESGLLSGKYVWTGTDAAGNYAGHNDDNCGQWSNGWSSGYGKVGYSNRTNGEWTNSDGAACNLCCPNPGLYCFEL